MIMGTSVFTQTNYAAATWCKLMDILEKYFDKIVHELAESAKSSEELEGLVKAMPTRVKKIISRLPRKILGDIKAVAEAGLVERHAAHAGFVERNIARWKKGFDLLELHIELAIEAGDSFNERLRPHAAAANDYVFDVLVRLHAKGCLISKEILTLLKNGYADGAHARWRALHEINVTAQFLAAHGDEATRRYLAYEAVETYKSAKQLNEYEHRINAKGFSEMEMAALRANDEAIRREYGNEIGKSYGWAQPYLPKKNASFAALEEKVKLDHWRPYYNWASQNVHASVKALKSSLGLCEAVTNILQVGPSNSGMTDPAHSTAISLAQLTCTLLMSSPNLDGVIMMKILLSLSDEIGSAFLRCDKKTSR